MIVKTTVLEQYINSIKKNIGFNTRLFHNKKIMSTEIKQVPIDDIVRARAAIFNAKLAFSKDTLDRFNQIKTILHDAAVTITTANLVTLKVRTLFVTKKS